MFPENRRIKGMIDVEKNVLGFQLTGQPCRRQFPAPLGQCGIEFNSFPPSITPPITSDQQLGTKFLPVGCNPSLQKLVPIDQPRLPSALFRRFQQEPLFLQLLEYPVHHAQGDPRSGRDHPIRLLLHSRIAKEREENLESGLLEDTADDRPPGRLLADVPLHKDKQRRLIQIDISGLVHKLDPILP
jgi:hypothetical protein